MANDFFDDDIGTDVDDDQEAITQDEETEESDSGDVKPDDSSQDDDDSQYSTKVQKRINKVVQQRNIERDKRVALEQEAAKLREQLNKLQTDTAKETIAQLKQKKLEALEIDDHQAVLDIDEQLMEQKLREQYQRETPPTQEQDQQGNYSLELPKAMDDWQTANQWIFDDTDPKTAKAKQIYAELINEGFDAEDPDTFVELDKKLNKQPRAAPPPTSPPDRGQVTESGQFQFTSKDKELMQEFGLDPNNKEHRKQWAISKKEAQNG